MTHKHSPFYKTLLTWMLVALLVGVFGYPLSPAQARQRRANRRASGTAQGRGSRGECYAVDREGVLTALVDKDLLNYTNPALTTQAHPTFLFYLPYSQTPFRAEDGRDYGVTTAEFELLDENYNSVLKNKKIVFSLPEEPGIVKVTVPNTEASLEPDKEYFWVFSIICNADDDTGDPSVAGWIKRVKGDSNPNLWFDRLEQLAESPTTYLDQWRQLLEQFQLEDLAQTPIVELEPEDSGTSRQEDRGCYYNSLPTRTYGVQ